jgi:O-antigen/teichoic acid export membrane protein
MTATSLRKLAFSGVIWSLVQNWGSKLSAFIVFVFLARFLSPAELGVASAALVVISLITLIAEFGFGDALVQRGEINDYDYNLPFFFALTMSLLLALILALNASSIEKLLDVDNMSDILCVLAITAPLTTLATFQEVAYKKNLEFKRLALRVYVVNIIAGPIAIYFAYIGFGTWSIVLQSFVTILAGLLWLWSRPYWIPSLKISTKSFLQLSRFGSWVVLLRLLDFFGTRYVDYIVVTRFGVSAFGLYSVGSRLYQIMMILMQSALNDVSLVLLSKISDDRERIGRAYLQSVRLAAFIGAPVFVGLSALSKEVIEILFGGKWAGVEAISEPLLLVGAIQCVQNLNGLYLNAKGAPYLTLILMVFKVSLIIMFIFAFDAGQASVLAYIFLLVQVCTMPLSFGLTLREIDARFTELLREIAPAAFSCLLAFVAVIAVRSMDVDLLSNVYVSALALSLVFGLVYLSAALLVARKQALWLLSFGLSFIGK